MNDHEQISALIDGELDPIEAERLFARLEREPALAEVWRRFLLQRAALSHEVGSARDISAGVMAALAEEPVVLAPRQRPAVMAWWRRPVWKAAGGMALAAGLTLSLVSLWQTRIPVDVQDWSAFYAAADQPQVLVLPASSEAAVLPMGLDEAERESAYLLAHAEYAGRSLQPSLLPMTRMAGQAGAAE